MIRIQVALATVAITWAAGACGGGQSDTTGAGRGGDQVPDRLAAGQSPDGAGGPAGGEGGGENSLGGTRKPRERVPENAAVAHTIAPARGFVDTPFAFNGAGGRLAYVNTDAAELCEIVVLDTNLGTEVLRLPLGAFTTAPLSIADVIDGEHFLVMTHPAPDDPGVKAAILDKTGKVVRSFGPATDLVRTKYDNEDVVVTYQRDEKPPKKGGKPVVTHTVEVFSMATGKRIGKKSSIVTDLAGFSEKLDFKLNHWADGYTRAIGIKGGEYDKKEDQRSPNVEAWYDVPRATFGKKIPIADVVEHTKRLQTLSQHSNESSFILIPNALAGLVSYTEQGGPTPIELAEPFRHYLHTSLIAQKPAPDGSIFFTLEIDPVHPDAVAQKRAEEKWIDLYLLAPGTQRAQRLARLPVEDQHPGITWRARTSEWAVLPRHVGFERGGPKLILYSIKPATR